MGKHVLSAKELDDQSEIKIHRWVEIGSEEQRFLDDTPEFTSQILKMGLKDTPEEPAFLCFDSHGRLWSAKANASGKYFPLHFEVNNRCYGYRNSKTAAN